MFYVGIIIRKKKKIGYWIFYHITIDTIDLSICFIHIIVHVCPFNPNVKEFGFFFHRWYEDWSSKKKQKKNVWYVSLSMATQRMKDFNCISTLFMFLIIDVNMNAKLFSALFFSLLSCYLRPYSTFKYNLFLLLFHLFPYFFTLSVMSHIPFIEWLYRLF